METTIKIYNREFDPFLKEITNKLKKDGYLLGEKKEISFGVQIPLCVGKESIGSMRVFQKKDGTITFDLSTVKANTKREEIFDCLSSILNLEFKSGGKINLPKSCFFRNEEGVISLFGILKDKYKDLYLESSPKVSQKKVIKLNGTIVTLYEGNNLVVTGKPTKLSDEVCELVDEAYEQSTREELLSQVKLTIEKEDFKKIKKEFNKIQIDVEDYISSKAYGALFANDAIDLKDGIKLLEFVKKEKIKFDNYAILVRNFAIVFEGFLIKLFINLGLIADEAFQLTERVAKIGALLDNSKGKSVFEKRAESLYQRRYPYLSNQLMVSWGLRCKYLHSDKYAPHIIRKISDAEAQIRSLIKVMETANEIFQLENDNQQDEHFNSYIGIDESGKGDYFGPLVIAGVEVDSVNKLMELEKIGVKDSKTLTDTKIEILAPKIAKLCRCDVVIIKPTRYNQLQVELGNLNYLLAWGHARALENLLQRGNSQRAISDQFGDESYINNALMSKGKKIKLEQRTKAERDIAVAAASIIARYNFVRSLREISKGYHMNFPKGASQEVINTAQNFVDKNGFDKLSQVAKVHFKTTEKIKK